MTVDPSTAAGQYEYKGITYYFCATSCLETFKADPEQALRPKASGLINLGKKSSTPVMPSPPGSQGGQVDPVCGMTVNPTEAAGTHRHAGRTYFFCSRDCLDRFRADPDTTTTFSCNCIVRRH